MLRSLPALRRLATLALATSVAVSLHAQVRLLRSGGYLESAFVTWAPVAGASGYEVHYQTAEGSTALDPQLIRCYQTYFRADALGLRPGTGTLRVIPVIDGAPAAQLAATTPALTIAPHRREGFAFVENFTPGGYQRDGTPKPGAKILYLTDATAETVTLGVINERGASVVSTGITAILSAKGKGYDKTPLILRVVGTLRGTDLKSLQGGNYLSFTGANTTTRKLENITIEGVGEDATLHGFGLFTKRTTGIEIRNLGFMMFGDDAISMEADNAHLWVHHCDFFYGAPGGDADQVKGDGSIDMKYATTRVTISFNHFWDSGKSTFAGGATEAGPIYFTYHHNWFDHSDSRHPRLTLATVHVYNNYYDGNGGMGVLSTEGTSAFVEANYFRRCKYPLMINMQGTNFQVWPNGTQDGGIIKAFNNLFVDGTVDPITQAQRPTDFDAYVVASRSETIPASVVTRRGARTYSNFDTAPDMYAYTPDAPQDVPALVTALAGRMGGGDFRWTFNNATDDTSTAIIPALKSAIVAYRAPLPSTRNAFAPWLATHSLAAPHDTPHADPDGDGLPNLLEYAFRTSANTAQTAPATSFYTVRQGDTDYLALQHPLNREALLAYAYETSADLQTWTPAAADLDILATDPSGLLQTIRARTPLATGLPRQFLRLRVHQP